MFLRRKWYARMFKKASNNLRILTGATILNSEYIECGDNVSIGISNYLQAGGGMKIGSDVGCPKM